MKGVEQIVRRGESGRGEHTVIEAFDTEEPPQASAAIRNTESQRRHLRTKYQTPERAQHTNRTSCKCVW